MEDQPEPGPAPTDEQPEGGQDGQDGQDEQDEQDDQEERHVPFAALVSALVVDDGEMRDEDVGLAVGLERVRAEFPMELVVDVDAAGAVSLLSSPPTQHVETTILPVFHNLRVTIERTDDAEE